MKNIKRYGNTIKATYNEVEYIFTSLIEFIIAYSTLRNIEQWQAKQREIDQLNVVM
jgi:hypothetical protein